MNVEYSRVEFAIFVHFLYKKVNVYTIKDIHIYVCIYRYHRPEIKLLATKCEFRNVSPLQLSPSHLV